MKKVYVCSDSMEGIYSAIYDAWKTKLEANSLGIALKKYVETELFCEYIEVVESPQKEKAVIQLIQKHLGQEAYWNIYHALLSDDPGRGDAVLGMMLEARKIARPEQIMNHLSRPKVLRVFELSSKVSNEALFFREILRFIELKSGVLFAEIEPRAEILACLGDHFSNRFPLENWMIYDRAHQTFLVHESQKKWILVKDEKLNWDAIQKSEKEGVYLKLWKEFFETIAIQERKNYKCQRNHLPLHYRKHIVEFQKE